MKRNETKSEAKRISRCSQTKKKPKQLNCDSVNYFPLQQSSLESCIEKHLTARFSRARHLQRGKKPEIHYIAIELVISWKCSYWPKKSSHSNELHITVWQIIWKSERLFDRNERQTLHKNGEPMNRTHQIRTH